MPEFPPEVIQRAAEVRMRQYESEYSLGPLTWRDFVPEVTEILDAVAEQLGEHCAAAILARMESDEAGQQERLPRQAGTQRMARTMKRQHFGIAARVASRAFLTEDDMKRIAARELAAGSFVASPAPEGDDKQP